MTDGSLDKPTPAGGLYEGLTPMEGKFVFEYMREDLKGREYMNQRQAAIRAGYSENSASSAASGLLRRPNVAAQIRALADERIRKSEIQAGDVLGQLNDLLRFDPADLFDKDGALLSIHDMPEHTRMAITSIETKESVDERGIVTTGWTHKIRFSKRIEALNLAMRYLKMLTDSGPAVDQDTLRDLVERSMKVVKEQAIEHKPATDAVGALASE